MSTPDTSPNRAVNKQDKERRRGWLLMILFFLALLIGCGLYWLYLTLDTGQDARISSVTPTVERITEPPAAAITPPPPADDMIAEPAGAASTEFIGEGDIELPPVEEEAPEPEPREVAAPVFEGPARIFDDPRWLTTATITGQDALGGSATFSVHLLSGANAWTFGKSDQMDVRGLSASADDLFSANGLGPDFCSQSAVIALGAASFEGEQSLNTRLARNRGETLSRLVGAASPACDAPPSRLVANLGEHRQSLVCPGNAERCPSESAFQRPIVIVAGRSQDARVNYGQALKAAIQAHEADGRQIFPRFRLSDYSQFDVTR